MDTASKDLIVGVMGGMGPQATADFLNKLVEATPVAVEQDHLRVLIDSNPKVPDRNRAIAGEGKSPGPTLALMARRLQTAGAGMLVMACNTAHAFESSIRNAISIPFVSTIEEACDACVRDHPRARRVGILAAPGCISAGLYQASLHSRALEPIVPDANDRLRFNSLLYRIKVEGASDEIRREMISIGQRLTARADVIVAGCTEVPLVLRASDLSRPVVDATWNLAKRCVSYARHLEPFPEHSKPTTTNAICTSLDFPESS